MKLMRILMSMLAAAAIASAAPVCVEETLADYLELPEGCTIGDKTFSQWQYSGSAQGGGSVVTPEGIRVVPITTLYNPGFLFTAGWLALFGQKVDSHITYTVTVPEGAPPLHDLYLEITGYGYVGDGSVTVMESTNPLLPDTPLLVYYSSLGLVPIDSAVFDPTTGSWRVTKDILLDGGQAGLASLSGVTNQFSEVIPEPMTMWLIGVGLVAIGLLRRRTK